jgi:CheY-like chemotaxis protein
MMQVDKKDFSLQSLLDRFRNEFDLQAGEKGVSINWPEDDIWLCSDPALLEQILRNYLSNAIRYTDRGSVTLRVRGDDGRVCIEVVDTGIGIPTDEQEAIFEEFHQLGNPERDRTKGLGLGLAIVKRAALYLEHPIAVTSTPSEGSIFGVSVERGKQTGAGPVQETAGAAESLPDVPLLMLNIDDEQVIREGTKRLLESWGCSVVSAYDEGDALKQLRDLKRVPDGIIADYRLPENKTGVEAINTVRNEYGVNVPALIVTGDIAVENLSAMKESGIQVLNKPVASIKLRTFLRYVLRKRAAVRA